MQMLRLQKSPDSRNTTAGHNSRLSELSSTIFVKQLKKRVPPKVFLYIQNTYRGPHVSVHVQNNSLNFPLSRIFHCI